MDFQGRVSFSEVRVYERCGRHSLCMDTLRLAIFAKNAMDVNKLEGTLVSQIHGFNITFYIAQLTPAGIYTFMELEHVRFPQSLGDLPSFFTLATLNRLLNVHDTFWKHFRKSDDPGTIQMRYKPTALTLDSAIEPSQDSKCSCKLHDGC